jgi:hypothetical protein
MAINPRTPNEQFSRLFWIGILTWNLIIACAWLLDSCTKNQGSGQGSGAAYSPIVTTLTGELVEAECIANDDAATASVQSAYAFAENDGNAPDATPQWFWCLLEGGTPLTCNACTSQALQHK